MYYYCVKFGPLTFPTDIKPANIMMNSFTQSDGTTGFKNVQITDLEDAVVLPPGSPGLGKRLSGNQFWRSPEAWARGAQHTPADIFSFGIVVSVQALSILVAKILTSFLPGLGYICLAR
jgi:serine/threonine protein kinase